MHALPYRIPHRRARPETGARGLFDAAVRAYVARRPQATVVALGEGLGTGFWRLDNGRLTWLTVTSPEVAAVRRMLLPDGPRRRTVACAPADAGWLDAVPDPCLGVVVTAPGVLRRLSPAAGRALLAACAARFGDGALVFDASYRRAAVLVAGAQPLLASVREVAPRSGRFRTPWTPLVHEVRFALNPGARGRTSR
ncbi:class I SAM-dependent methyltransferase [Streptomyces natalensis]|uniref:class I SAM-dependent methyltransferase n=1 Tax=Streptomyces natalensis TaxID=68242 RepID=UPI000A54ED73|nr:class I SAM-dependent methyltransferase [Streptomyces natalensis]